VPSGLQHGNIRRHPNGYRGSPGTLRGPWLPLWAGRPHARSMTPGAVRCRRPRAHSVEEGTWARHDGVVAAGEGSAPGCCTGPRAGWRPSPPAPADLPQPFDTPALVTGQVSLPRARLSFKFPPRRCARATRRGIPRVGGSATGWWFRETLSRGWLLRIVGADRRLGRRDAAQDALAGIVWPQHSRLPRPFATRGEMTDRRRATAPDSPQLDVCFSGAHTWRLALVAMAA
jgi:hypothetical protein